MKAKGHILNISFWGDITHLWLKGVRGETLHFPLKYHPRIYAVPPSEHGVASLSEHSAVHSVKWTKALLKAECDVTQDVLEIEVVSPRHMGKLRKYLQSQHFTLFNIDLPPREKFFYDTRSFPFGSCILTIQGDSFHIEMCEPVSSPIYHTPDLRTLEVQVDIDHRGHHFPTWEDRLTGLHFRYSPSHHVDEEPHPVDNISSMVASRSFSYSLTSADESLLLKSLVEVIQVTDPDVLLIDGGDRFTVNFLVHRAREHGLLPSFFLGRLEKKMSVREDNPGQTYVSYGTIIHKDLPVYIPGRIHIDPSNSFFFKDSGISGVIELSRLAGMPPDRCARSSIGTVLTSIELQLVSQSIPPILIPVTKAKGEMFKDSGELLSADNGGLIYPPSPGIYENVWGIDFTSLYPSLMLKYNISSETVLCKCCSSNPEHVVPSLEYHICTRRQGVVARTMQIVMSRRLFYKYLKAECDSPSHYLRFDQADSALKWILVACLDGSSPIYRREGDSLIEERIDQFVEAYSPSSHVEVLGMNDRYEPEFKRVRGVIKIPPPSPVHVVTFEDNLQITATADHLWPIVSDSGWQVIRTDKLVPGHLAMQVQISPPTDVTAPHLLSKRPVRVIAVDLVDAPDYVYCLQLDSPTPWFATRGGVITHNCFGYLGFKNARWGSIESHQCVTAYARHYLRIAEQIANEHGYVTIAGITDSLFVQASEPSSDSHSRVEKLIAEISKRTGVAMDIDGKFSWIVFPRLREQSDVAPLNRYYGAYTDGSLKIRGIEARKRSSCPLVKEFQLELLTFLSGKRGRDEFLAALPRCEEILLQWQQRVREGVDPRVLLLKTRSTRGAEGYRTDIIQASVARRYLLLGHTIRPGQTMKYIVVDYHATGTERVLIEPELSESSPYDRDWYCSLLLHAFQDLFALFHSSTPSAHPLDEFFRAQ